MARSPLRSRPTSKSPSRAKSPKSAMTVKNEFNCYIRWMLVLAVVAIFVVCLVMYLKNYKAVRAVVDTNLGFHSTFLYETWFVIINYTASTESFKIDYCKSQKFIDNYDD